MNELTSGSTWHATGNILTFSCCRNVIRLQHYSTELYARLSLVCFRHPSGGLRSEMTLTRLDEDRFLLISGAPARRHDLQWLEEHLPFGAAFTLEDVSERFGTLVIAGPASRAVFGELLEGGGTGGATSDTLSNTAFPWLSGRELTLDTGGDGIDVLALRVNYLGELCWELYVAIDRQSALYEALMAAGAAHGLRDVGMHAMESMRLEKSYRAWKVDLDHALSPLAAGLERFVDVDKAADFVGKAALREEIARGPGEVVVTLELEAAGEESRSPDKHDADERIPGERVPDRDLCEALFGCPIRAGDSVVGSVTSGGYGHRIEKSLALGYVAAAHAEAGPSLVIDVLGTARAARVVPESPYGPENLGPRGGTGD